MGTTRKLTYAALTDVGMKRSGNEDAYIVDEMLGVYVVCDGMGGHASGEVASQMTTEQLVAFMHQFVNGGASLEYKTEEGATESEKILSNSIQHANDKVYIAGMRDPKLEGMGTTIVAVQAQDDRMVLAHVGDSRIYRWRDGALEQLTRDHSLLNHKIDIGELKTKEQIKGFKHGNIIVRAIGLKDYVRPETAVTDRQPGDILLLCSDGLTDLVDDWAIENVVEANQDDLDEAAQILIRMANDRGGKDNITVVLIRVDDAAEGFQKAASEFHAEATVPAYEDEGDDDEVTDPTGQSFELPPEDDDDGEVDYDKDDDRTQPHRPVFMWEDLDEEKPAASRRARKSTAKVPSIIVDEDDSLPSIIIDD